MHNQISRRQLLSTLGMGAAAMCAPGVLGSAVAAPAVPVAIGKCKDYGPELLPALEKMFDQLGGLGRLVKNKTVVMKINLTGGANARVGHLPAEDTYWTHPKVIGAAAHLLAKAGARRIRVVECANYTAEPLGEFMMSANWDPDIITGAASNVELLNVNWLGGAKKYSRFPVPNGGYLFKAYDLNHNFEECDVFVSVAKLKQHLTAGITLTMKNHFGSTPATIYGDGAGKDEPSKFPVGGREMMHSGDRQPAGHMENDPKSPREGGFRIPRVVADLCAARPIHLGIIDGILTMSGGEGPWASNGKQVDPGVMIAGLNPVCTDAVGTAVMGFDPMADRGAAPFETCDSYLRLAEDLGLGTRDLKRIEVVGVPIQDVVFRFSRPEGRHRQRRLGQALDSRIGLRDAIPL